MLSRLIDKQTDNLDQLEVSNQKQEERSKVEELETKLRQAQIDNAKVLRQLGEVIAQRENALKKVEAIKKKDNAAIRSPGTLGDEIKLLKHQLDMQEKEMNRSKHTTTADHFYAQEEEISQLKKKLDDRSREMIQVRKTYAVMNAQFGSKRMWYEARLMDQEKHWEHKTAVLQQEHKEMSVQNAKLLEFKACQKDRYRV